MVSFKTSCLWTSKNFKSLLNALAVLDDLPRLRRVMGLVVSADFLHTFFHKNVSYKYQMTKFYYLESVVLRVKVLQIESECS